MIFNFNTLSILLPLLLLLFGLGFTVMIDPYISREQRRIMLIICLMCLSLIAQNYLENKIFISHSGWGFKNVLSAYGYSVRPVILILFLDMVFPEGKRRLEWAIAGINAVLYFSSPFTKLCFEIRKSDFASLRGPLWFTCFLISGILLLELLIQTIIRYRETKRLEQLIPVSTALIIVLSVVLDFQVGMEPQSVTFLTISVVVSSVFYYIWLHFQFVREHEQDLVATQRIKIMMTQIQPHFLFNALNTIRALYKKDPSLADRTLENFSTYLRQNLESLSQTDLIPVSNELEHTRLYAEIETLRFPNVHVEYEIEDEDFEIPALTIQPLLENAIRHGVRSRKSGVVIISTILEENFHRIVVRDNGCGFDTETLESAGESHVGIRNVRDRVEKMCGGSMILKSAPGKGTSVSLLIPREMKHVHTSSQIVDHGM